MAYTIWQRFGSGTGVQLRHQVPTLAAWMGCYGARMWHWCVSIRFYLPVPIVLAPSLY